MYNKIKILQQLLRIKQIFQSVSRDKKILGGLVVFLTGFLLYQSLLTNQLMRLKAKEFQWRSQAKLFRYYAQLEKNIEALVGEVQEEGKALAGVKEMFVADDALSSYFADFRNLVKSHKLEILSLDFKAQESIKSPEGLWLEYFLKQPFDVSVKGNYFNIMFLLYKIERGKPLFGIQSVHIRQEGPQSYDVVMDMRAAIYVLNEKTQHALL